ncbi:hypothetical protein BC830DRAFT_1112841 [Chytriomyces sp. MP71]|nr:hypothetical protein BC830DRAFT_1112841 [Chytriomyces sp. MP71]
MESLWERLSSRKCKDFIKGMLAYFLCFCFVFSSLPSTWLQPRTLANVLLVPVVLTPAKTVGKFADLAILYLISVCASSVLWAFVNVAAPDSAIGMGATFFLASYAFSVPRAINPARYFGEGSSSTLLSPEIPLYSASSLSGPIFVFAAIQSRQGAYGPNTANGAAFDTPFLVSTLYSYLVGVGICLAVNLVLWPDFAERDLRTHFSKALTSTSTLTLSLLRTLDRSALASPAAHATAALDCRTHVSHLAGHLRALRDTLDGAAAEVGRAPFSMPAYAHLATRLGGLGGVAGAVVDTVQRSGLALCDAEFVAAFSERVDAVVVREMGVRMEALFLADAALICRSRGDRKKEDEVVEGAGMAAAVKLVEALGQFRQRVPNFVTAMVGNRQFASVSEVRERWRKVMQANAVVLGIVELAQEALVFHRAILETDHNKKVRIECQHAFPFFSLAPMMAQIPNWSPTRQAQMVSLQLLNLDSNPNEVKIQKRGQRIWRQGLFELKNALLSAPSIYGFKCGVALLLPYVLLFLLPDVFKTYHLGATVVTFLIALTPSLGQTFQALPNQIVSTSIGAVVGFLAIYAFGKTGTYGIVGFGMILGLPFMFLMLFNPQHMVLGLLTLLAYNYYVIYLFTNADVPGIDSPAVYLSKTIITTSIAIAVSLCLTTIIFPTLSRNLLRKELSILIRNLGAYYTDILLAAFTPNESDESAGGRIGKEARERLQNTQFAISTQLGTIESLLATSALEPRVQAPFQKEVYRRLVDRLKRIFDLLEGARYSVGSQPLAEDVRAMYARESLRPWRGEMNQTMRLLFYIYSSALISKEPLPAQLPNASHARERFFDGFIHEATGLLNTNVEVDGLFSTEAWMRVFGLNVAVEQVSVEMDMLSQDFKALFGELPNLHAMNPELAWTDGMTASLEIQEGA